MAKTIFAVSKQAFQYLVGHLVDIEENKNRFLDEFFPGETRERAEMEGLISSYIDDLEGLVKQTKTDDAQNYILPFVVIGSEVEVMNMDTHGPQRFRILKPFESVQRAKGIFNVSCFSPVGKALLLKRPGNTIRVEAPAGTFAYQVESIQLPV